MAYNTRRLFERQRNGVWIRQQGLVVPSVVERRATLQVLEQSLLRRHSQATLERTSR